MSVATARVPSKKQTLDEAYSPPANFLEIDVADPATHGFAKTRYTDYEIRMKTNLPVFKMKVTEMIEWMIDNRYLFNVQLLEWVVFDLIISSSFKCIECVSR